MSQAKTRLLELNKKLAQTLVDKGIEATADETTTALINKVADISDDTYLRTLTGLIQRDVTDIVIPVSITRIGDMTFHCCNRLKSVIIPNSVTRIGRYVFADCNALKSIIIPASITIIGYLSFNNCTSLIDVALGNGFNADGLDLSSSTKYTAETIVSWLNALADRTGQAAYTLTIGAANLAKLTKEQIAVATAKNWTLA